MSPLIVNIIVALLAGLFGSGFMGFIQFLITRSDNKKDVRSVEDKRRDEMMLLQSNVLVGLGHDRITFLGTQYLERGYITKDEFENLNDYLYKPYKALGGNGTAKKIMEDVEKLPIRK